MRLLTALILTTLTACRGSAQVHARGSADAKADAFADLDRPEPFGAPPTSAGLQSVDDALTQGSGTRLALLGARHDLSLRADLPASCECVAFVAGLPTDGRFSWEGPAPQIQFDSQLVVGFRADTDCLEGRPGPSYRGYQVEGANVILLLETVHPGRPELTGAVIPRPRSGGRLLVRVPEADTGFGQALDGSQSQCELPFGSASATPLLPTRSPP